MSVNTLGTTLLSGFLVFATALAAPAQSTAPTQDQSTKKQTTAHKDTTSKEDIRNAQQALKDKGIYTGAVDGTMNTETKKALSDFQKKNNLEATGTLNHDTMTALGVTHTSTTRKDTSKSATPGATTPKKQKGAGKSTSGVTTEKLKDVQAALKKEGFDPGPVDGIMGPRTMGALRNFQAHKGLEVTGALNTETENALMASAGTTRRSKPGTSETEPAPTTPKDQSGLSSVEDVRGIQQALTDLGYEPGETNGLMTSQTREAIRQFQYLNNLPVTGNLDQQTKAAIDAQMHGGVGSTNYGTGSPIARGVFTLVTQTQATKEKYSSTSDKEGSERIAKSTEVLQDLTTTADKRIPNELLERAEAIAVIPHVIKGAFGIGGRFGKGVISQRLPNGRWSPPAFVEIGGGSFGAQLGVSSTDLVLVFTDRNALSLLEGGKDLKIGADASAVAGPIGRSAEAGTNVKLESAIYSYSRSKGLFAGVSLDGAVLSIDKDKNEKVYGTGDAREILNGKVAANTTVQPFVNALEKVSPKKRISQK